MTELKFLKDLPIKLTNNNKKAFAVVGGDIYYDSFGNRYGFVTFNNLNKSPLFSLQLAIREFSIEGKFIRDNEYFEPYVFYPKGEFVLNEPIPLDKETEALEITVVKAALDGCILLDDKRVPFKKEDYIDLYQKKAPVKKAGKGSVFSFEEEVSASEFASNNSKDKQPEIEYEEGAEPSKNDFSSEEKN